MLFASFDFLLFSLPVLAAFWWLRDRPKMRLIVLIVASYFFYMASSRPEGANLPTPWYYAGLLVFSTLLDFYCARGIARRSPQLDAADRGLRSRAARERKILLIASLVGNLGVLAYFKYTNFAIEVVTDIARALGADWVVQPLPLLLPIGISFYTFQSLSYTIDVWRGRLTPEPSLARFAAFVVFFPQLVAGPIVRAREFLPQLHARPRMPAGLADRSMFRIWKGLVKKVVLGDFIAVALVDPVFAAPGTHGSLEVLLALYGFTLQIYADFSGYSDIAIGVGGLLGFNIPENFDRPYQSRNIAEFWRRWHMTLSTWLRDYLFFPLGGTRLGPVRSYLNLWLTMFLVGMWHAASWNFVVYANLQAGAMMVNRWNRLRSGGPGRAPEFGRPSSGWLGFWAVVSTCVASTSCVAMVALELSSRHTLALCSLVVIVLTAVCMLPQSIARPWAFLHVFLTFHFTVLSRVFFRADDLNSVSTIIAKLLDWDGRWVRPGWFRWQSLADTLNEAGSGLAPFARLLYPFTEYAMAYLLAFGIAYHFTPRAWVTERLARAFAGLPAPVIALVYAATFALLMHLLDGPRANIYFEF